LNEPTHLQDAVSQWKENENHHQGQFHERGPIAPPLPKMRLESISTAIVTVSFAVIFTAQLLAYSHDAQSPADT
jgi:hypothetical protein